MSNSKKQISSYNQQKWRLWLEQAKNNVKKYDFAPFEIKSSVAAAKKFEKSLDKQPEIKEKVKKVKKITLKDSKLFFDGRKLYWLTGGKVFKSWPATSGHHQDLILSEESIDISLSILKVIKNAKGMDLFDLRQELESEISNVRRDWDRLGKRGFNLVRLDKSIFKELVESFWNVEYIQEFRLKAKPLLNMKQKPNSRLFIRALGSILDRFGLSSVSAYDINAASRRDNSTEKDIGPIPEGKYIIKHKLQEAPIKANPDAYTALLAAIELYKDEVEVDWTPEQEELAKSLMPQSAFSSIDDESLAPGTAAAFGAVNLALQAGEMVPESADMLATVPWGNYRLKITKINSKALQLSKEARKAYNKRFGFYIHGGSLPGSSGCIDLGPGMDDFAQFWSIAGVSEIEKSSRYNVSRSGIEIPLEVRYLDDEKRELLSKNKIAQEYDEIVFSF
tara:strand:- start:254 stop:1600 length:1347 start_codon:yes stop_codon:yes gene_type:complete